MVDLRIRVEFNVPLLHASIFILFVSLVHPMIVQRLEALLKFNLVRSFVCSVTFRAIVEIL